MKWVTLRVPASTSNLGSGFDTLGLAVNLYNRVTLRRCEGKASHAAMIEEAAKAFFKWAKVKKFGFEMEIDGDIPVARGLGASGALRAAVVAGLNRLSGGNLSPEKVLELVTDLEGHPDNASPALWGGCTVSGRVGREVRCLRFRVSPQLAIIALIPDFKVSTEEARRLVPENFSKADTAHSLNRSALIASAFAARNYEALRGLFDDRLHQPYRELLVPQLPSVIRAGERAGAIGGFLSGSGSAIICLTSGSEEKVARAMKREVANCETRILRADNRGLVFLKQG